MIAKAMYGCRPGGLLAYLFGPGKHEEHENPRVVASWDGAPWLHQPDKAAAVALGGERIEPGPFDFALGPLRTTLEGPVVAAGLPVTNPQTITPGWADWLRAGRRLPPDAPDWVRRYRYDSKADAAVLRRGPVWHTPVRLHPRDRTLTDDEWERIAERLMRAVGIDQAGCRWIAVRHADDHIHLVATLVSEVTGKRFHTKNERYKLRDECRLLEREYGLVATSAADRTALRAPTRAEQGKAERTGREETAREELCRVVRQAAAAAEGGADFLAKLASERIEVRLSRDEQDGVRGYSVALPGDKTADGNPVWYSGTKLGRDLSWPKLGQRWADLVDREPVLGGGGGSGADIKSPVGGSEGAESLSPAKRRESLDSTTEAVEQAAAAVRAGREVDGIAHAAGEVLAVLTRAEEGRVRGPLAEVSDHYDRAARTPYRVLPPRLGPVAIELRRASRRIAQAGRLSGRGREKFATLALMLALAGLITEIAAWQQSKNRVHQAAAARSAAGALPRAVGAADARRRPAARPVQQMPPAAPGGARPDRPLGRRDAPGVAPPRPRGRGG